jgi:hypothetical protein
MKDKWHALELVVAVLLTAVACGYFGFVGITIATDIVANTNHCQRVARLLPNEDGSA